MEQSWVKVYRKLVDNEWWEDAEAVKMWLWLLMEANTEDRRWKGTEVPRGQLITSIDKIALACQLTPKKVRLRLEWFEKSRQITWERANKFSRITLCNYATYQDKNEKKGTQRAHKGRTEVTQKADKGHTEVTQTECQRATPKEYKENNNIRENSNIIIQESKNERIFFKSENEKKIFSIEEIKQVLDNAGILWTEQGYMDFKENNENPEASFNYNGGILKSAKQYQKLHPEIIKQNKKKNEALKYSDIEVAPDVKHTLQMLIDRFSPAEQTVLKAVKFQVSDNAEDGKVYLPSKVYWEINQELVLELGEKLKEFYGLESYKVHFY